jgi:hypothetical protein
MRNGRQVHTHPLLQFFLDNEAGRNSINGMTPTNLIITMSKLGRIGLEVMVRYPCGWSGAAHQLDAKWRRKVLVFQPRREKEHAIVCLVRGLDL